MSGRLTALTEKILDEAEGLASDDHIAALAATALTLRRAGIVPTFRDMIDPAERSAWAIAGKQFAVENAVRNGVATIEGIGPALVTSELDGGQQAAYAQARLTAAGFAAARRAQRGRP